MKKSPLIRFFEHVEMFLYRRADAIVPVTYAFKREMIERGVEAEKIFVVINGVDISRYSPTQRDNSVAAEFGLEGKFIAGYMGTHGMAHALPKVLEAAELLLDDPDLAFFFAGSGAQRNQVERIVTERGLHNVKLIPRQPKERMPALWSLCDVSIVPLRNTPVFATVIPSKIFESMAMGVPILMSLPEGEATDMIRVTGSGICVPPEDPIAMAEALRLLKEDRRHWNLLRSAGIKAAPRFSRRELAADMISVFDATLRKYT